MLEMCSAYVKTFTGTPLLISEFMQRIKQCRERTVYARINCPIGQGTECKLSGDNPRVWTVCHLELQKDGRQRMLIKISRKYISRKIFLKKESLLKPPRNFHTN